MTIIHLIGIITTIAILVVLSVVSGRNVHDAKTFAEGKGSGTVMVFGIIMAALAGGQSTIGTAQLAFCYGLSAWWFTIGAALGCVALAIFYVRKLRDSHCLTIGEVIAKEYGHTAETIGSLLCIFGIFISIMSQVLASSALITSLFGANTFWAAAISAALIVCLVFFGGIKSAGIAGIVKSLLLLLASIVGTVIVMQLCQGPRGLSQGLHNIMGQVGDAVGIDGSTEGLKNRYGNIVARGVMNDCGGALSLLLGVLSTQTYAQAIFTARSTRHARRGLVMSAVALPIIGAACTIIGLYMRSHYLTAAEATALAEAGNALPAGIGIIESSAQAFPTFIINHCPQWIGGIFLGTLFVTVLGGGSGLALGVATIMVRDVYNNIKPLRRFASSAMGYKLTIVALMAAALVAALLVHDTLINDLGFLSLGLRATALLLPVATALFMRDRFSSRCVVAAMVSGTATMLIAKLAHLPADPIFYGIGIEVLIMAACHHSGKASKA